MLADSRTIGAPFYAPRYWIELWEGGNRRVAFDKFSKVIRPLAPTDRAENVRDHCGPTRALIEAVGDMRVVGGRKGWWTDHWALSLDGWCGYDLDGPPPPLVVAAIAGAYPLPTTLAAAHDEYAYWAWRAYMITTVWEGDTVAALDVLGAPELDLVCQVRAECVRRLLVRDLVAGSIGDVELRLRIYVFIEERDRTLDASVLRDLMHLKNASERPAPGRIATGPRRESPATPRTPGVQNPLVTAALLRKPRPSDRAIARSLGVSPTTVGSERRRLIAAGPIDPKARAVVERRNVRGTYEMKPRGQRAVARAAEEGPTAPPPAPSPSRAASVFRFGKAEQLSFPWETGQGS